ncbi:MAG: hypothetical protein U0264_12205 [Candidatus Kapaibacterium sp.]
MTIHTVLTGWHFMRWLRLGLGIFIGVQAIQMHDTFSGFIAVFFLFQAVTNTGCCGTSSCAVPQAPANTNDLDMIDYEEVQQK